MVVPRASVGTRLGTEGAPGRKVMQVVPAMQMDIAGNSFLGMSASLNSAMQMGYMVNMITNTLMPP